MYKIFRFGEDAGPNGKTTTFNGNVALYHDYPAKTHCSIEIQGPKNGTRARMIIDKATARKLGAALLGWAGFNVDTPLLVNQIEWLAGLGLGLCNEQEGLLNLLGALRDLSEEEADPTTGTPEAGYHPGSLADPRD